MQGIYKITNRINGKCYVGQSGNLERRFKSHKNCNLDYPLYKAFRKYGIENFTFEVLEEVKNKDDLTPRELHWYNCLEPEYNQMVPGSDGVKKLRSTTVIRVSDDLDVRIFNSMSLGAIETQCSQSSISEICNKRTNRVRAGGFYWCFPKDLSDILETIKAESDKRKDEIKRVSDFKREINSNNILQIDDKSGEVINKFRTLKDAGLATGANPSHISKVIRGLPNFRTAGGFKWSKSLDI